jgi:ferredoxin-fold anticodon binding domain-containing protein
MEKSQIYYMAQQAVLTASGLNNHSKLEILRELMEKEDLEKWKEKQEEKETPNEAV